MLATEMRTAPIHREPFIPFPASCLLLLLHAYNPHTWLLSYCPHFPAQHTHVLTTSTSCPHVCKWHSQPLSGPRPVTLLLLVLSVSQREPMGEGWLACKFALLPACLMPFHYFAYSRTLNIDMVCSSKMSDDIYCIKHCYILETELFTVSPTCNFAHVYLWQYTYF